jgi:8-oxo-dGTP diphosphatase
MSKEYYENLPKKRMSSGALILNEEGNVLIVKPSYKDHWSIAGGVVEKNESPKVACIREVEEEIGLDIKAAKFLCLGYIPGIDEKDESLQFIFFGGMLNKKQINKIKIDGKEIVL